MPWVTVTPEQLAKKLGVDYAENKQKQQLIEKIIKARNDLGLTQAQLAKKLGLSQSRIAKIESRVGVKSVTFDLLFRILAVLGYRCNITTTKTTQRIAA